MTRGWFNGGLQLLEGDFHGHDWISCSPLPEGLGWGLQNES